MRGIGWRWLKLGLLAVVISGCASLAISRFDQLFGPVAPPPDRTVEAESAGAVLYTNQIQPLLANRCVVCHACYDAPCQLKLTSAAGIERGINPEKVYNGERLLAARPTRLHIDAQTTAEWRGLGFSPVLNERDQTVEANLQAGMLMRALYLKKDHPLPSGPILPASFDFKLDRNQQCPTIETYDEFSAKYPLWGMPYGTPGLTTDEMTLVENWVAAGAPMTAPQPVTLAQQKQVDLWEGFFNQEGLREQLVARYIYEHLFLNHIYFDEIALTKGERPRFFNLVRSATPPGEPVKLIATRRPYDDPKVARVYYRLLPEQELIVAKTHNPYAFNKARMERFIELFLSRDYQVTSLPGYEDEIAANPFKVFADLPLNGRHKFMLDNAESTIMGFIKGPVCRGQMAVNVIDDQFWVFFVSPDLNLVGDSRAMERAMADNLRLPSEAASNALPLSNWIKYSRTQTRYLSDKVRLMNEVIFKDHPVDLNLVWDGNGTNANAALTVFRHFDNATVVQGLVGDEPKTAWLIDYALFERIHYLLVSGFDIYGNVGHQLVTRLYMDFLRMEGEFNFLALLPSAERLRLRDYWYRGANDDVKDYVYGRQTQFHHEPAISYQTAEPKSELLAKLQQRLAPVLVHRYELASSALPAAAIDGLRKVDLVQGIAASLLPEVTQVMVMDKGKLAGMATVMRTSAHSNISSLFDENANRLPAEDEVNVVAGIVGDYPNAFWQLDASQMTALANELAAMTSEADYERLMTHYGVRRSDARFWPLSDAVAKWNVQRDPIRAGILDYNRLENR